MFTDSEIIQTPEGRLGFNIAFGIIDIGTFKAVKEIEQIGSFKAEFMSKNSDSLDFREIPIHRCTQEDKKKFYKPNKIYQGSFDLILTELYCITRPEKLVLNGDWNGDVGSVITLNFEECDS